MAATKKLRVTNQINVSKHALPWLGVLGVFVVWHLLSLSYPPFILPSPLLVAERFIDRLQDGTWFFHTTATFTEALAGLSCGVILALLLGYAIAKLDWIDRLLSPIVVASQGIPFIAVAPLIFIWFGNGMGAKILLCTLIVFFPILINVVVGIRNVSPTLRDLFRVYRASPWQTLTKLEIPAALPTLIGGLRVGGTLSMIGAIAAEFTSASRGLGFMIQQGNNLYDTALVFVGVLTVIALALMLYIGIGWLGHKLIKI